MIMDTKLMFILIITTIMIKTPTNLTTQLVIDQDQDQEMVKVEAEEEVIDIDSVS